jgi:hypothetical protein
MGRKCGVEYLEEAAKFKWLGRVLVAALDSFNLDSFNRNTVGSACSVLVTVWTRLVLVTN